MFGGCSRGNSSRVQSLLLKKVGRLLFSSSSPFSALQHGLPTQPPCLQQPHSSPFSSSSHHSVWARFSSTPTSIFASSSTFRYLSTSLSQDKTQNQDNQHRYEADEDVEPIDLWEEEDDAEPEIGDGGDGGGVVLQNCPWGERALSIAHEVLLQFDDDMKLYSFKTTPRGYVYVRLDKLPNKYGCPSMEEIEDYSRQYKKKLEEIGEAGEIPEDLALEVSSPGAERLLKVPDDLCRFKDMSMWVSYVEDLQNGQEKIGVFFLDSIETESGSCVWRLADVKENRDPSSKGRPLSRKLRDWRLKLPYALCKRVTLYLDTR